ncbi:hypothetical protein N9Z27_01400 [Alphaproteobacteria bacterium]|nr:hypothetical protein [Alphaproteobacteria bacterium]
MVKPYIRVVAFSSVFVLAACGDGWESHLTNTHFPYGNIRTAGSGVAYVRAKLLPEKELKIVPVSRTQAPAVAAMPKAEPEAIVDMEPVFKEKMTK